MEALQSHGNRVYVAFSSVRTPEPLGSVALFRWTGSTFLTALRSEGIIVAPSGASSTIEAASSLSESEGRVN